MAMVCCSNYKSILIRSVIQSNSKGIVKNNKFIERFFGKGFMMGSVNIAALKILN